MSALSSSGQRSRQRELLLTPRTFAALSIAMLLALLCIAPSPGPLDDSSGGMDILSLKYLRLWVAVRPGDDALKLRLAQTLLSLGELDETQRLLAALDPREPKLATWAAWLRLRLHLARLTLALKAQAQPPAAGKAPDAAAPLAQLRVLIEQDFTALFAVPLSSDELSRLATQLLGAGRPDLAMRVYLRLAEQDREWSRRRTWLAAGAEQALASGKVAEAGRIYDLIAQSETDPKESRRFAQLALAAHTAAASGAQALDAAMRYAARFPQDPEVLQAAAKLALMNGQPGAASRYYDSLVELVQALSPSQREHYATLALLSASAADDGEQAMRLCERYLSQLPESAALLRSGVRMAMANSRPQLARQWGRILLSREPQDIALLASQITSELAVGDVAAALELARRLSALQPDNVKVRVRLAEIAEWAGNPHLALAQWAYLAMHSQNQIYFAQALKMAPLLYDLETLAKLLALKARRGRLTDGELASLVSTFEEIARPEELVGVLEDYLRRYPEHEAAWESLAEVQERRGQLPAALALYERTSRTFGSNVKETTHRATLLWQLHKPTQAYVLLRDVLDHSGAAMTRELLSHVDLALLSPSLVSQGGTGEKPAAQRHAFFDLMGQLLWHSEARPESIEEYRLLWRERALLPESAGRYIKLAQAAGQFDEALSVAEEAFRRFSDPEFLLWAMDHAQNQERFSELGRLIAVAHEQVELFADSPHYFLILAAYYAHTGEFDRAQRAYLRVIALDPGAVAARAEVLWILMDHSDNQARESGKRNRHMLLRLLTAWRPMAEREPALWLPFATGFAMLGRSKDAEAFYQREWTRRPTDHLWLVGYASTLDAVSRNSDARHLRRFTLEALRPEALRAARPHPTRAERELLHAYAELVRDVYGAGKGSRWMSPLFSSELPPDVKRGLASAWRSDELNPAMSDWVLSSGTLAQKNPWGRFPKAAKPGQSQQQPTLADAGSLADDSFEPPPEPLRALDGEAAAGEETVPKNAEIVGIEAGSQMINGLAIFSARGTVLLARGAWALGGQVGVNHLFLRSENEPDASSTEVDLALHGIWRHRLGRLEAGLGANLRADANLFSGWLDGTFSLFRGGTLHLGAHFNELASDTPWLRIYGARHRATAGLSVSFLNDGFVNVQGSFYQYHTRTNEALGIGANAEVDLGYRIRRVRPLWTVRLSGSYTRNSPSGEELPEFGRWSSSVESLLDVLPQEFLALGVGSRIEHRFPGAAPLAAGRLRYMADVWLGWMWPVNILGFEARAGLALALPRKQEISLSGFVANNRWLGPGVVNAGVSLRYLFR